LLETVLDYFRDPKFNDAIVIQGAPGCGKSSFTLRLANVLRREGLRPLRIRLKFLDLKKNLSEALAQVVLQPEEDEDPTLARLPQCSDPFLNDSIFQ
jgi:KaiC/GvpD/RAD55 family RecA-like ATPase